MQLHRICETLHSKILRLRSVERIVSSIRFNRLWEDSDEKQRVEAGGFIEKGDRQALITWIKQHPSLMIEELFISQLKELACGLLVCDWSRMSRLELIAAIKETKHVIKPNKIG